MFPCAKISSTRRTTQKRLTPYSIIFYVQVIPAQDFAGNAAGLADITPIKRGSYGAAKKKISEGRLGGERQQVPPLRFSFLSGMRSSGSDDNSLTLNAALNRRSPLLFTPAAADRAGSGIAKSSRPARGSESIRSARPCARLLRGRRLRWLTGRRFPGGARD
jgi:hypothetical protein